MIVDSTCANPPPGSIERWTEGKGKRQKAEGKRRNGYRTPDPGQRIEPALVARAAVIAVYLPMHTATRLALPIIDRLRTANPEAVLCAYGLYAPLNADLLRAHGITHVLGPEFEADLLAIASGQPA